MKNFYLSVLLLIVSNLLYPLRAQEKIPTGILRGKIYTSDTKLPLIGANILIQSTLYGAASNLEGSYIIEDLPVGSYTVEVSYIGFETVIKTDVVVRSRRVTVLDAELRISAISSPEVRVTAGYFSQNDDHPLSVTSFSREEIRRAPGSAGDVSRIILGLPGLAKVDDQSNTLIVRGGSPLENTFFIDNMEIPNINHFPTQGASGGALSLINVDFIEDVNFYSGGFPAVYGDKLSSVMELTFREGNRQEYDLQLDLNLAGLGGVAEGPLLSEKGSWMVSARRSYIDFLVNVFSLGTTMAPSYGDYQGKMVYDINSRNRLTVLGVAGDEHNNPDQETAIENDMIFYGNQDNDQHMLGGNWRLLWGRSGFSNTSITYTASRFMEDFYETGSGNLTSRNRSLEQNITFRNLNHLKINNHHAFQFGIEARLLGASYDNYYSEYPDAFGNPVPELYLAEKIREWKFGVFTSYDFKVFESLTATPGLRGDYFSYGRSYSISPRFSLTYRINNRLTLEGATGVYYQNLPLILLSTYQGNQPLPDLISIHYILGMKYLLTGSTRLSLEVYQKNYQNFPVDPGQPSLFVLDEIYYQQGYSFNKEQITADGTAYARGIEFIIQKKLARDFYGLASASYFRTRYQGSDGVWRNRIYDNRLILSVEGGYKPNHRWEFSGRWIYAGGRPYTPYHLESSRQANHGIYDPERVNGVRYPAYHSLNVRFDRRFYFNASNLIAYISIWNAYNRLNVSRYYWNQSKNAVGTIYQFGILPIFGLEFEF